MKRGWIILCATVILLGLAPTLVHAHEAYVLPADYFWGEVESQGSGISFDSLTNPNNLLIAIEIGIVVFVLLAVNFLIRQTTLGRRIHRAPQRLAWLGPLFVRFAIALALFFSALDWSFLGPELSLHAFPVASLLRTLLFASSIMIFLGLFTEIAAGIAIVIFSVGLVCFGTYLTGYLTYLGGLIVLVLFGMRTWSLGRHILGPLTRWIRWERYGTTIVLMCFGLALIYAALSIKLLHPEISLKVVTEWNLTQFGWLFPSDPALVVLGAGLV